MALQENRVKAGYAAFRKAVNLSEASDWLQETLNKVGAYTNNEGRMFPAGKAFHTVSHSNSVPIFFSGMDSGNVPDTLSYILSLLRQNFHIAIYGKSKGIKTGAATSFSRSTGVDAGIFQSAGWIDVANRVLNHHWTNYLEQSKSKINVLVGNPNPNPASDPNSNTYITHKPAWFNTMTCVDPAIWRDKWGYNPDPDSLGPYYMLAQVWDDPDPEKVRNALTAVRELNVATAMIDTDKLPEGRVPYMVDGFLLLYDYDIRSVNMRRIAKGLAPVEVETYIYDYDLPLEPLPFAIDDVFYPAYCKMCEEIGVEPYVPENPIKVRLDVERVRVERVG